MAVMNLSPTRMEMKKLSVRLATARRGHKLLKDKCDELMKRFLDIVKENMELRQRVEASLKRVNASFSVASALTSKEMTREALMLPKKEGELSVSYKNLMSVNVPVFDFDMRDAQAKGLNYGFAFTSGELDLAVSELCELLPELVKLAEVEKTTQMLAQEIERTRRRVNALEYIMIPQYEETIKSIKMKLEENERGNTARLMKVKSMALERELKAKKKAAEET